MCAPSSATQRHGREVIQVSEVERLRKIAEDPVLEDFRRALAVAGRRDVIGRRQVFLKNVDDVLLVIDHEDPSPGGLAHPARHASTARGLPSPQSNISTVRATSPAFMARKASLTSSSLPRRLTISSSFNRPWR